MPTSRGVRADLLLGKPLEDLLRFPHVDDADPVIGLRDEVRDRPGWRRPALLQAHLLKDLVVLVERCASERHVDCYRHGKSPFEVRWACPGSISIRGLDRCSRPMRPE